MKATQPVIWNSIAMTLETMHVSTNAMFGLGTDQWKRVTKIVYPSFNSVPCHKLCHKLSQSHLRQHVFPMVILQTLDGS